MESSERPSKIVMCVLCERNIKSKAAYQLEAGYWMCGLPGTRARQTCDETIQRNCVIATRIAEEKKKKGA